MFDVDRRDLGKGYPLEVAYETIQRETDRLSIMKAEEQWSHEDVPFDICNGLVLNRPSLLFIYHFGENKSPVEGVDV